jgi:lipopolysaccharide export system protein LptA|tara:strand:+ start:64 stop:639 length:576 start_codon:yes stop_codon:yes gene_type:complete
MKKIIIQLFLIIVILVISITFQKKYFNKGNKKIAEISLGNEMENYEENSFIKNFSYSVEDIEGNKYTIESKNANYSEDKLELIIMKNVQADVYFIKSENVTIYAKSAIYNSINHDTEFFNGVSINYSNHNIESDNLNLSFNKKIASISDNIIYKNLDNTLQADKIEIDLITKNSKIFMYDKSKNIKIINKR